MNRTLTYPQEYPRALVQTSVMMPIFPRLLKFRVSCRGTFKLGPCLCP